MRVYPQVLSILNYLHCVINDVLLLSLWITTLMLHALDDSLTSISDKAVLR